MYEERGTGPLGSRSDPLCGMYLFIVCIAFQALPHIPQVVHVGVGGVHMMNSELLYIYYMPTSSISSNSLMQGAPTHFAAWRVPLWFRVSDLAGMHTAYNVGCV